MLLLFTKYCTLGPGLCLHQISRASQDDIWWCREPRDLAGAALAHGRRSGAGGGQYLATTRKKNNHFNHQKLLIFCQKLELNFFTDFSAKGKPGITSTAKQVLSNCERMVLANFIGNRLLIFILWIWLSTYTFYFCTVVLCC